MHWGAPAAESAAISTIDATLNRLRMRGDPLADAVALRLDVPPSLSALSELRFLAKSEIGIYQELLDQTCIPPDDLNPRSIEQGRQIQLAFSAVRDMAWLCGALPQGLGQCTLLHPDQFAPELRQRLLLHRRINQTLTQPDSLLPGGALHELLLQQRLQWALQRKAMREAGWNPLEFGEPLNQEYLLLILLEYTQLTLHNMARLGARLSDSDNIAVDAFWRLALHWLGLDGAALAADRRGKNTLLRRILWRYSHDVRRRQQQQLVICQQLRQRPLSAFSAGQLLAAWHWCTPDADTAKLPDRGIRWLIAANRGATLAHYHVPGMDLLRQQWRTRQLRDATTHAMPNLNTDSQKTA